MSFDEINSRWIDGQQRFNRHDVGVLLGMLTDSFDLEEEIDNLREQNAQLLEALKYIMNWTPDKWNPETARELARAAIAAAERKG